MPHQSHQGSAGPQVKYSATPDIITADAGYWDTTSLLDPTHSQFVTWLFMQSPLFGASTGVRISITTYYLVANQQGQHDEYTSANCVADIPPLL
jgi:hypothetical protein